MNLGLVFLIDDIYLLFIYFGFGVILGLLFNDFINFFGWFVFLMFLLLYVE